ncbi:hypothetical protein SLEP1_g6991 [Rubroshorea leprosula]|uniref:Uncharacterized protein n=1 Tax=Rubroshorea leprosula TaxID=152421 RepID=A0AAV5I6X3_9ROSI|nr:hypothetical protein SLEP1_g6991 [Rubroshorea leprosula]
MSTILHKILIGSRPTRRQKGGDNGGGNPATNLAGIKVDSTELVQRNENV